MNDADRALAERDQSLLATLRERVERRGERLEDPDGDAMDELEVEGLAVLMKEWVEKADRPAVDVQNERRAIREKIDAFHAAASDR